MRYLIVLCLFGLYGLSLALSVEGVETSRPAELSADDIYVVDGDTIRVDRHSVRLTGFNTPETRFAECETERAMGYEAKAALLDLIKRAERVDVAYQTNADGSYRLDKYQRRLGRLVVDGENAGRILIERRLAEPYGWGKRRDWCG